MIKRDKIGRVLKPIDTGINLRPREGSRSKLLTVSSDRLLRYPSSNKQCVEGSPHLCLHWGQERTKLTIDKLEVISFDLEGRPIAHTKPEGTYRRGLDGRVKLIRRFGDDETHFFEATPLTFLQIRKWESELKEVIRVAARRFNNHAALKPATEIDLQQDAAQFRSIFGHIPILPPDQYRALVLQLSRGCSYNGCTFCNLYKDKSFNITSPDKFSEHIEQAVTYFGKAIAWRRGIFLGDGNAGNLPTPILEDALRKIQLRFRTDSPRHPLEFDRVSAFLDGFTRKRSLKEWRLLHQLGLTSVNIGMESGSKEVLRWIHKPGHPDQIEALVSTLKEAGIQVNIIIMSGVGGKQFAEIHVKETVYRLNRLPLTSGDRIYISEFLQHPDSVYAQKAEQEGITPLSRLECRYQTRKIRGGLRFPPPPRGPWISLYDIRQFLY